MRPKTSGSTAAETHMQEPTRREFNRGLLQSLGTFALLKLIFKTDALAGAVAPVADRWLKGVHEMAGDLRARRITQVQWQQMVERLFARVELKELLRFVDFARVAEGMTIPEREAGTERVRLPALDWLPEERGWGMQIFALRKGAAVTPHGHHNMVSMHLVLQGEMRVRHFERIRDEPQHVVMRPSIDRVSAAGDSTTISDDRDNIHWLRALSETAFTLDVVVSRLNPDLGYAQRIVQVDPARGEKLGGGLVRARIIGHEESLAVYSNPSAPL